MEYITAALFTLVWAYLALCARPADFRAELGLEAADRRAPCPARRETPCLKRLRVPRGFGAERE